MAGEIKNLCRVWLAVIGCLCYCHFISARLPKGRWKLISLVPIFCIFTILPLYTTSAFFTAVTAFFVTWLANFKLLLFAFDRGPIAVACIPKKSLPTFLAITALPFKIKPKNDAPTPKKSKKLPLYLITEIPISAVLIAILFDYKQYIPPYIVLISYCCLVFLLIEILIELSSSILRALQGLELEPASDEPYLSTSLQDFWGKRWNLTVNSILRLTIYKPVRSAASAVLGRHWAAMSGVLAAFLVSGLMHELLFWYVTRANPSWEMTMFFVFHGVCVVVELGLKVALAEKKWRVPWFVSGPLTVGFVAATSFWLFFPPLMRNGADKRVIEELRYAGELVKENFMKLWLNVGHSIGGLRTETDRFLCFQQRLYKFSFEMASTFASGSTPAAMMSAKVDLSGLPEKFSGQFFRRWQQRMKIFLTMKGLLSVIQVTRPEPTDTDPKTTEIAEWTERDSVGRGIILSALSNVLFDVYCSDSYTAKSLWDELDRKYNTESKGSKSILFLSS